MTKKKLFEVAKSVGEYLFNSSELKISREEFVNFVGNEYEIYFDVLLKSLSSLNKIDKKQGRHGGLEYKRAQKRTPQFFDADLELLKSKINENLEKLNKKRTRNKPEEAVEIAFKKWLLSREKPKNEIINFRSWARKNGKWKNVDGYKITTEEYKYHISFKPILTTYEVKANIPTKIGIAQAKDYLDFSHFVYLVFKDHRDNDAILDYFNEKGLLKNSSNLGIYVTKDCQNFRELKRAIRQYPNEKKVDDTLEKILSEIDKNRLEELKNKYLQNNLIKLLSD